MNITQEMIDEVDKRVLYLTETMLQEALPVRVAMYGELQTLQDLKAAYEEIQKRDLRIEELYEEIDDLKMRYGDG